MDKYDVLSLLPAIVIIAAVIFFIYRDTLDVHILGGLVAYFIVYFLFEWGKWCYKRKYGIVEMRKGEEEDKEEKEII